ncbi:MAG TPA: urease accessory UreF family protein [Burkholderiaceae bacterium]|nr:urease accessory UreF family protein [Burkholderiaceae bacterium]
MDAAPAVAGLDKLLALLHLASPALPVGGFAYSQGLEKAIEDGVVADEGAALRWIGDLLEHVLARAEAPLWLRAYAATRDADDARFATIDRELLAIRETAELRAETRQMAASLQRALAALGLPSAQREIGAYPAAFARACAALDTGAEAGLAAYLWAWLENQVLAVVKCVPLGQQAGQRLLHQLRPAIARTVVRARALDVAGDGRDEVPGAAGIGFAITCAAHETQYSRLFRS